MLIKLRLLKNWGEYKEADEVMFGESKGMSLIARGIAVEVKSPGKVKQRPEAETTMANPVAETAEVTPDMKVRDLKKMAQDKGIDISSAKNKDEIIETLRKGGDK